MVTSFGVLTYIYQTPIRQTNQTHNCMVPHFTTTIEYTTVQTNSGVTF